VISKQVVLWVFAILIVNVTWAFVSESEASYEINSSSQTEAEREVNVAEFFGFSKPIPSRLEMTFYPSDAEDQSFSYSLGNTQTSIAQGTGLAPASLVWNGEIKPGEYIMNFESTGSVTTDQTLVTQPFMPYRTNGHIVASLCLIILSFGEVAIKGVLQSRKTRSAEASKTLEKKGTQSSDATPYADDEQSPWRDPIVL
jgi:hypothetical protein